MQKSAVQAKFQELVMMDRHEPAAAAAPLQLIAYTIMQHSARSQLTLGVRPTKHKYTSLHVL